MNIAFWDSPLTTRPADSRTGRHPDGGIPAYVTEAEYWQTYYHFTDKTYEWNDGVLEEKGMSDQLTYEMHEWFWALLRDYLRSRPVGKTVGLETAFSLVLPGKKEIRRPDLGIVLNSNPVPILPRDEVYKGVFDLCIEAISHSTHIKRDTVDKKFSYARAGVGEYFILDGRDRYLEFYTLGSNGIYVPIPATRDGVIQSQVLPGFQFRRDDLFSQPAPEEMAEDPVYQGFVMRAYQQEKTARLQAEAQIRQEQQARRQLEQRADQLAAQLRAAGIDPNL